jgi:hypothetical protein
MKFRGVVEDTFSVSKLCQNFVAEMELLHTNVLLFHPSSI